MFLINRTEGSIKQVYNERMILLLRPSPMEGRVLTFQDPIPIRYLHWEEIFSESYKIRGLT